MNENLELLSSQSSRDFLKKALQIQYQKQGRVNLSDFSRRAGFSSRSFLSEYLAGKKKLSRESLRQIKSVLKIPKDYTKLFNLFVTLEQPELFPTEKHVTTDDLLSLKNFLQKKYQTLAAIPDSKAFIGKRTLFRIYAALGSEKEGASLKEIQTRTGLNSQSLAEDLQQLIALNVVAQSGSRYFANSSQIDFLSIKSDELISLTKEICSEISDEASNLVPHEQSQVFYTAFSIQSHQLKKFKKKMREAIYDVLDQFQDDDGDCVQQLFLCSKK